MAARKPGSPLLPGQRVRRPLDDDDEILGEQDGEATLAQLVADWDGTVLSIADIAARETDPTIAKHISDAQAIAAAQFEEDFIKKIVRDSGYRLTMLIEDSTTVSGFMVYSYSASVINVVQIGIAEAHRGRGLGRCAVTWLLEHAKKAGLDSLTIECRAEGVKFYERCGFKQGSRTPDGILTMCLNIKGTETSTPPAKDEAPKASPGLLTPGVVREKGRIVPAPKVVPKIKGKTVPPKAKMQPAPKRGDVVSMSRGALVMRIFDMCDADGDKVLKEHEMYDFAVCGGFKGSAQEWTKEYKILCVKCTVEPNKGLDMVRFEQVLNVHRASTYTDMELQSIFTKLNERAKAKEQEEANAGRAELVKTVFEACDVDKDGALGEREMKRVVIHIGFTGTDEEWAQEYNDMCLDNKRDPTLGINFELFEKLVNDDTESGCYCSNADLEAVLANKVTETGPKVIKPPPKRHAPSSRESITMGLFKQLDRDRDGYLNLKEMQNFASLIGFKCDDEKWAKEYALFCEHGKADPEMGVDEKLFIKLVNDRSDAGCYCSDGELKDMLKELNPNAGEISSRGTLISAVFRACDRDGDGRLNGGEMRNFAGFTGFDGDDEAWDKEYKMLCSEVAAAPDEGVAQAAFTKLVNDTSERGCYCRDTELAAMIRQMGASGFFGNSGAGEASCGGDSVSLTPVSRAAVIRTLFHLCDKDENKLLNEEEMHTFAATAGFDGGPDEWTKEYHFVCQRGNADPAKGLNPAKFIQVINSGAAGRYTDTELKQILEKLELQACLDAGASGRSGVIRAVFHACDLDSDGYLNRQEMKNIATHVGFKGTADEWAKEYRQMCLDHGAEASAGIDLPMLELLVNDSSESGCYCSDRDLRAVLQSMGETTGGGVVKATGSAQSSARSELIRDIFKALDLDRDGTLDEQEMRGFAYHVGFEGTDDDWAKEYALLCREKRAQGVDLILFEKLVDDNSENGCHCTDLQLQAILTGLELGFR
uniref:Calmodulin n=1 Tax=Pyrodinium bahamense TaxID=73915 RepID=A0A7R9ZYS0_9DINO